MDKNKPAPTVQYYEFWYENKSQSHSYDYDEVFPIEITVENTLQSWSTRIINTLIVQFPIVNMYITCPWETRINRQTDWMAYFVCKLWIADGTPAPTNVTISVDWGDNSTSGPVRLLNNHSEPSLATMDDGKKAYAYATLVHPQNYTKGGTYSVNVSMDNLVNKYELHTRGRIIEKIVDFEFFGNMIFYRNVTYNESTPERGWFMADFPAFGKDGDHFPGIICVVKFYH